MHPNIRVPARRATLIRPPPCAPFGERFNGDGLPLARDQWRRGRECVAALRPLWDERALQSHQVFVGLGHSL